jgi:hypothetical protein
MPRKKKEAVTQNYAVATVETVEQLDALAIAIKTGGVDASGPFSQLLGLAHSVQLLRAALTPEIMAPIMELQSTPLGFRTDKDVKKKPGGGYGKGDGYPVEVVKDIFIEACRHGANFVGNELNIIAGRCYLTKEFFNRRLDETLGAKNWRLVHTEPAAKAGGAVVTTSIQWRDKPGADWQEQTITLPIKGDGYTTAENYLGKADRKAGAWLYRQVSGEYLPDGDAGDAIDVTARTVSEPYRFQAAETKAETQRPVTPVQAAEPTAKAETAPPEEKEAETPEVDLNAEVIPGVDETPAKPEAAPPEEKQAAPPAAADPIKLKPQLAEVVRIPGANRVNDYLMQIGFITQGQSYRDLNTEQMTRIVNGKDAFIAKCLGDEDL